MIPQKQIAELVAFKPDKGLVLSFYLDTDLRYRQPDVLRITAKNLIQSVQKSLKEQTELPVETRQQALYHLERIQSCVHEALDIHRSYRGLAVFAGTDFWQVYHLPHSVKDGLYVDRTPYIRPLMAILNEYHRILIALVTRRQAVFYEYYMGELSELEQLSDEVPGRVRMAGWYGLEERRVRRHIHDHEHQHYKRVADRLFQLHKAGHYEKLILGGHESELPNFREFLHPYVRDCIIGDFPAEPELKMTPLKRILEESRRIEQEYKRNEDLRLVNELIEKAKGSGPGVLGLAKTLTALMQGAVHTLVVEEEWKATGRTCPECGSLMTEDPSCLYCGSRTQEVADVVEEAIAYAIDSGALIRHVHGDTPLNREGHIGALLRFRL